MKVSSTYGYFPGSQHPIERSSANNRTNYNASSRKDLLINWVNSIEYPNCLLASDISDFKDGVVLCELVNEIVLRNSKPDFLTLVKNDNITYQDSLHNITMALNEIRSARNARLSQEIVNLQSHEVINNEDKLVTLLEYLYRIDRGENLVQQAEAPKTSSLLTSHPKFESTHLAPINTNLAPTHTQDFVSSPFTQHPESFRNSGMISPFQNPPRNSAMGQDRGNLGYVQSDNINMANSEYTHYSPKAAQAENERRSFPHSNAGHSLNSHYQYLNKKTHEEQNNQSQDQQISFNPHYQAQNDQREPINQVSSTADAAQPQREVQHTQNLTNITHYNETDWPISGRKSNKTSSSRVSHTTPGNNKRSSQARNPSITYADEVRQTTLTTNIYSQSPTAGAARIESRNSFDKRNSTKNISSSHTPQKPIPTDESKFSGTNFLQQRINELKQQAAKQGSSHKQPPSRQNLSPFKTTEVRSANKGGEADRRNLWENQTESPKMIVTPVPEQIKAKIISWLVSITLLRENIRSIQKNLPKICKDGVLFIDLINRLEGKHEAIKGNRGPHSKTHIYANYQKVLNFLGRFEKMNPRYLLAHQHLTEGDEDVFWGLLDDIWHLYSKKISPYDPRYTKDDRTDAHLDNGFKPMERSMSYNDIIFDRSRLTSSQMHATSPAHTRSKSPSEYGVQDRAHKVEPEYDPQLEHSNEMLDIPTRDSKYESNRNVQSMNDGYQSLHSQKNSLRSQAEGPRKSIIKKGDASKFFSQSFEQNEGINHGNNGVNVAPMDEEQEVIEWIKHMGFKSMLMRGKASLFEDPFRNGTLLCYLVGRIENERMHSLYKEPKSIDECRHNVYYAFQVMARKQTPIPNHVKGKEEEILKGNDDLIQTVLHSLMRTYQTRAEIHNSMLGSTFKSFRNEASVYVPPYDENEKNLLEQSLVRWTYSLGLFREAETKPRTFKELAILMRNGVLLCDLTSIVTNTKIPTVQRRPVNELQCIINIRKALEILRQKKMMGQKYLWKERDIYTGNRTIILGLLEDLRRFFDGVPPRNQANYFCEGPYIPAEPEAPIENEEISDKVVYRSGTQSMLGSGVFSPLSNTQRQTKEDLKSSTRRQERSQPNFREQVSKLNLSSDEPISIVDYERNLKASFNSITTVQNQEIYMNTTESRWNGSIENSFYKSPKAEMMRRHTCEDIYRTDKNNERTLSSPKGFFVDDKRSTLTSFTCDNYKQLQRSLASPRGYDIKEWIVSLGFGPQTQDVDFDANIIEDLRDGVLLCKVIGYLELKELPGVILKPRTNASKILNIRKCLKVLEKRPNVNPYSLNVEDQILAGDGPTIRRILNTIRESYKFMDNCVQRTQSPSTSRFMETMRSGMSVRSTKSTKSDKMTKSAEKWNLYRPNENYILTPKEREKAIVKLKYSKS